MGTAQAIFVVVELPEVIAYACAAGSNLTERGPDVRAGSMFCACPPTHTKTNKQTNETKQKHFVYVMNT